MHRPREHGHSDVLRYRGTSYSTTAAVVLDRSRTRASPACRTVFPLVLSPNDSKPRQSARGRTEQKGKCTSRRSVTNSPPTASCTEPGTLHSGPGCWYTDSLSSPVETNWLYTVRTPFSQRNPPGKFSTFSGPRCSTRMHYMGSSIQNLPTGG